MATTDPVADLLTRIRNASTAGHRYVEIRWSKLKEEIVSILKKEGFITDFTKESRDGHAQLRVFLKYHDLAPVIQGIKRVSSPGCRRYVGREELPKVLGGMGIAIVSTSRGVLTDKEARKAGTGGEVLCSVW